MKNIFFKIKEKITNFCIISFKKPRLKFPHISMNICKTIFCIFIPLFCVAGGIYIGISEHNKEQSKIQIQAEIISSNKINRRIYLISTDNLTIPLTVSLEPKATKQEEIYEVFNLLKVSSKANSTFVKGFINDEAKLKSFKLEEGILTLDLSKSFLDYGKIDETRFVEAFTMSFLEFEDVKGVSLMVEGESLNRMPRQNIYVNNIITSKQNINNLFEPTINLIDKEKIIVFYERKYNDSNSFLVPVTVYTNIEKTKNIAFVSATRKIMPSYTKLKRVNEYNALSVNQDENSSDFSLVVEKDYLVNNSEVNKKLYELVSLSLDLMGEEQKVSFTIDGEEVPVNNIYTEDDKEVGSIIYNEIKI